MKKLWAMPLVILLAALLASCQATTEQNLSRPASSEAPATPETVEIKLYFAKYTNTDAYLVPEEREVEKVEESALPFVAVKELLKGPQSSDLSPTLPPTAKVLSVEVDRGVAVVNFSKEIITDANLIGQSSTTEALALGSIVNTLTEFPGIKTVKILVEGKESGQIDGRLIQDFWGHIGLYEPLVRNEKLIGPSSEKSTEETVAGTTEPAQQTTEPTEQETSLSGLSSLKADVVLSAGTKTDGKEIYRIRYHNHGSFSRFVFDVRNTDGSESDKAPYSVVSYYKSRKAVTIIINGIRKVSDTLQLQGPAFALKESQDPRVQSLARVSIEDDQAAAYVLKLRAPVRIKLFTLLNPARVVVDISSL